MIITLTQTDIEQALTDYVQSFMGRPIKDTSINITAGRGQNGFTADVDVNFSSNNKPIARSMSKQDTPHVPEEKECVEEIPDKAESPLAAKKEIKEGTLGTMVTNPEKDKPKASIWEQP